MAQEKSQSRINIKQRVIGATVLVALAIIVVPLVMDLRQDYDRIITSANIPPKPDNFRVEVFDLDIKTAFKVPIRSVDRLVSVNDGVGRKTKKTVVDSVATADPAKAQERIDELRHRVKGGREGRQAGEAVAEAWVVQLASLTRKENALRLRDRVSKKGLHAFIVSSEVEGRTMYRVLVGPAVLRSSAEKWRQRLQEDIKLSGMVVRYRR